MEPRLLFPQKFRYLGYLLAIPGFILGYLKLYQNDLLHKLLDKVNVAEGFESYADEVGLTTLIIGLLFIAFARLKHEDELTAKVRIYALYWAILVSYILYAICVVFMLIATLLRVNAGGGILGPLAYLIGFSELYLFSPLIIFTCIFYYVLLRKKDEFVVRPMRYLPNKPYRVPAKWLSIVSIGLLIVNACLEDDLEIIWLPVLSLPLFLLIWAFSKEKSEDEFISDLRLEAMQVAVYINYGILIITTFVVYGADFWTAQYINLCTIPLFFIIWFQYKLHRINQQADAKPLAS